MWLQSTGYEWQITYIPPGTQKSSPQKWGDLCILPWARPSYVRPVSNCYQRSPIGRTHDRIRVCSTYGLSLSIWLGRGRIANCRNLFCHGSQASVNIHQKCHGNCTKPKDFYWYLGFFHPIRNAESSPRSAGLWKNLCWGLMNVNNILWSHGSL